MVSPGCFDDAEDLVDRLLVMKIQEETSYAYSGYLPCVAKSLNNSWREKICQWAYNVVDHFDLSREVVAVSLDIFDRYLATRGNQCNGNLALLTSLTTLAIAIKLFDHKRIKITTLSDLSRGQFGPQDIEKMEYEILDALKWKIHPPTQYAFVSHMVFFFSDLVHPSVRKEVFELARYLTELAVCDSYFVTVPNSTVALAAILNVLDETSYSRVSASARDYFSHMLLTKLGLDCRCPTVMAAQSRLRTMFVATEDARSQDQVRPSGAPSNRRGDLPPLQQDPQHHYDARLIVSPGSVPTGRHSRSNSFDSKGNNRISPSPCRFLMTAASGRGRSHGVFGISD